MPGIDEDRARRHTAREVLQRIDAVTVAELHRCATGDPEAIERRLVRLDAEWDLDRTIEAEAAGMGLLGLALATFVDRRLLAVPATVAAALFLFASTGRYPLAPLFRRAHIRTGKEIERERYALKALRGDFADSAEAPRGGFSNATAPGMH